MAMARLTLSTYHCLRQIWKRKDNNSPMDTSSERGVFYRQPNQVRQQLMARLSRFFHNTLLPWVIHHYPIVVLALGAVILAEVIWGSTVLQAIKPITKARSTIPAPTLVATQPTAGPSFTITSDQKANIGKQLTATITLDTFGQ